MAASGEVVNTQDQYEVGYVHTFNPRMMDFIDAFDAVGVQ
jgi:hypothetical protein